MTRATVLKALGRKLRSTLLSVDYSGWYPPPNNEEHEAFSNNLVVLDVLEFYGDSFLYGMLAGVIEDTTSSDDLQCCEAILRTISCNAGLALFMIYAGLRTIDVLQHEKFAADRLEMLIGVAYRACGRERMVTWMEEVFGPLITILEREYFQCQPLESPKPIHGRKRSRRDEVAERQPDEDLRPKKRRKNVDKENVVPPSVSDRSRRLAHAFPTSQFNFRAPSSRISTERESYNSNRSLLDRIATDTPPVLHIQRGGNSNSTAPSGSTRKTQLGQINGGYLSLLERLETEDLMPAPRPPRISASGLSLVARTLEAGALPTLSSPRDIANMTIRQPRRGPSNVQPIRDQHGSGSAASSCSSMATQSARFSASRARGRSAAPLQEISWAARLALGNHTSNRISRPFSEHGLFSSVSS